MAVVCGNGVLALLLQERMCGIFQMTISQALNAALAQTVATEHFANEILDADSVASLKVEFGELTAVLIVIGIGIVVAIAVGYFVLRTQTRKLRRLVVAIERFRASQFKEPIPVPVANSTGGDELDQLSVAYNDMIVHIRRQMELIAEADAKRRELVAYVLHDLRTPLASLRGYLETLIIKQKWLSAEDHSTYLGIAYKQSDYMSRLIDGLFELVKLEEIDMRMELEPFQLGELAQDVLRKFTLKTQQRGLVLESRIASDVPLVYGDVALIERLLDNLIENAIRHTLKGKITVTVAAGLHDAKLEVADTGSGISADDIPHIFERFYRVEKRRNHLSGGDGLGLAIAKRIVELHAGRISVHSEIGVGTSFRVELPFAT